MPWPEKQRRAIYLQTKRKKGEKAAKKLMHEAGYGEKKPHYSSSRARKRAKRRYVKKG